MATRIRARGVCCGVVACAAAAVPLAVASSLSAQGTGTPPPPVVLSFTINNGAPTTTSDQVTLRWTYAHGDVANDILFVQIRTRSPIDRNWQQWGQWDLGSRLRGNLTRSLTRRGSTPLEGVHQFQIRLRDKWDQESAIATASITRASSAPAVVAPVGEVSCPVNSAQAYSTARQRGWEFSCNPYPLNPPGSVLSANVVVVGNEVACAFRTGPPVPVAPRAEILFFKKAEFPLEELMNGWYIKSYRLTRNPMPIPAIYNPPLVTSPPLPQPAVRINRFIELPQAGSLFHLKITELVLANPAGGSCATVLNSAF